MEGHFVGIQPSVVTTVRRNQNPAFSPALGTYNIGIQVGVGPGSSTINVRTGGASAAAGSASSSMTSSQPRFVHIHNLSQPNASSFPESLRSYLTGSQYPSSSTTTSTGVASTPSTSYSSVTVNGTSNFRRSLYEEDRWAKFDSRRKRNCSASFYRSNPAQTHRLLPFINREANALLQHFDAVYLVDRIRQILPSEDIRSTRFRRSIEVLLRERTDHFIHELYCFASSIYDTLEEYDQHVTYVRREEADVQSTISSSGSIPSIGFLYEDDEDNDLVWGSPVTFPPLTRASSFRDLFRRTEESLERSRRHARELDRNRLRLASRLFRPRSDPEVIELSDDSDEEVTTNNQGLSTAQDNHSTAGTVGTSISSTTVASGNNTGAASPEIDVSDPSDEMNIDIGDDLIDDLAAATDLDFDEIQRLPPVTIQVSESIPCGSRCPLSPSLDSNSPEVDVGQDYSSSVTFTRTDRDPLLRSPIASNDWLNFSSSSDETESNESVCIIGSKKPRHLRTPEIIDVPESDEEEEVDVEDIGQSVEVATEGTGRGEVIEERKERQEDSKEAVVKVPAKKAISSVIVCPDSLFKEEEKQQGSSSSQSKEKTGGMRLKSVVVVKTPSSGTSSRD